MSLSRSLFNTTLIFWCATLTFLFPAFAINETHAGPPYVPGLVATTLHLTVGEDPDPPSPPPSQPTPGNVEFSGLSFPSQDITLTRIGGESTTDTAGSDGAFTLARSDLPPGEYSFEISSRDSSDRPSRMLSFQVVVNEGSTTRIENIVIPPTLSANKSAVEHGEMIALLGESRPNETIELVIENTDTIETYTDTGAEYHVVVETEPLPAGSYTAYARTRLTENTYSEQSTLLSFTIEEETLWRDDESCLLVGDFNCDDRVDVFDLSILAYWYQQPDAPARMDLTNSGTVDLGDFSVLLYFWTG